MVEIDNRSGLPHVWFEKMGPSDVAYDVLVVRGTFDFASNGEALRLAEDQTPVVYGDEFDGPIGTEPLKAVLRREGNLVLYKPGTDVYVSGNACVPGARPISQWIAEVRVGEVHKALRLHGRRWFRVIPSGWQMSAPEPTVSVELDYRRAFGGFFTSPPRGEQATQVVYKPDNPAGCGWLPNEEALRANSQDVRNQFELLSRSQTTIEAPQIEHPDRPVQNPYQRLPTEGFSPVSRWSDTRLRHAGVYDETWRRDRYPSLPESFDPQFYQAAPPDMIFPGHMKGDEQMTLAGLLAEGECSMRLPGMHVFAHVARVSGSRRAGPLRLDTVSIDLDDRNVVLVWRAAFQRLDPVVRVAVGVLQDTVSSLRVIGQRSSRNV